MRDRSQAVRPANAACARGGWREPDRLDTLAAACAEIGQYEAAVRWERRALAFPALATAAGA